MHKSASLSIAARWGGVDPHCSCGTVLRRFAAGMRPPFSPRGENGPRPVQKTRQEGDFDFPLLHLPPTDTKGRAAALPFGYPTRGGCKALPYAPHERLAKRKARRGCRVSASVDGCRPTEVQAAIERHFVQVCTKRLFF